MSMNGPLLVRANKLKSPTEPTRDDATNAIVPNNFDVNNGASATCQVQNVRVIGSLRNFVFEPMAVIMNPNIIICDHDRDQKAM